MRRGIEESGIIEPPMALGALAGQYWWVPKFTAERYPELLNYVGLRGEEVRPKLAEIFKRPTTWKDYCEQVSTNNCTIDDGIASRPPQHGKQEEEDAMFVEGLYTGHFRKTEKNNCTANPDTCTGHFADYPWYVKSL